MGGLQSVGSQRVRHDWVTEHTRTHHGVKEGLPHSEWDGPSIIWKAVSKLSSQDQSSHSKWLHPATQLSAWWKGKHLLAQSLIKLKELPPGQCWASVTPGRKLRGWADLRVWRLPLLRWGKHRLGEQAGRAEPARPGKTAPGLVQLLSGVQLFAIPWTAAWQSFLSSTISQTPGVCSNSWPLRQWCYLTRQVCDQNQESKMLARSFWGRSFLVSHEDTEMPSSSWTPKPLEAARNHHVSTRGTSLNIGVGERPKESGADPGLLDQASSEVSTTLDF